MVAQHESERTGVLESRYGKPFRAIIGIDEVGRGALAGPLTVAAVAICDSVVLKAAYDQQFTCWLNPLTDSKKLTPTMRNRLSAKIIEEAEAYSIVSIPPSEIDEVGINEAFMLAADRAAASVIANLSGTNYNDLFMLTDGLVPAISEGAHGMAVPKADALSWSVAAASVIAKVARDHAMSEIRPDDYNFAKHKGYGTAEHYRQLRMHGLSSHHRRSFSIKL